MRATRVVMWLLEWLHLGIFLPALFPAAYLILIDREDALILPLICAGTLVLIPAGIAKLMIRFVKSFVVYLLLCAALLYGTYLLSGALLSAWAFERSVAAGFQVALLIETAIVMLCYVQIRLRENARYRARIENDISFTEREYVLEKPFWPLMIYFVILYILSRNYDCKAGCDASVACFIAYAAVTCLYRHLENTEAYAERLSYIRRFPYKRVRRIGAAFTLTFLIITGIACTVPAVLTQGLRSYRDLRAISAEHASADDPYWQEDPLELRYMNEELWPDLVGIRLIRIPPWLDAVVKGIAYVATVAVLILFLKAFWHFLADFRAVPEENGDISEDLAMEKTKRGMRREKRYEDLPSDAMRVRRRYKKEIRRRRKDLPKPQETPHEIESATDLIGTPEGEALHTAYEEARYAAAEEPYR